MGFISLHPFGQVPRAASDPNYPRGFGVPNPVPAGYTTGAGSRLQCGHTFSSTNDLIREFWMGFQRALQITGTVSIPPQDNFTSFGAVSFAAAITPLTPESPGPALPRPSGADPLRGPVSVSPPPGIRSVFDAPVGTIASDLLAGSIDLADSTTSTATRTDMPVWVRLTAQQVLDVYPWYEETGGRTYYCNVGLIVSAEAYWDEGWTAEPMPGTIFPPWISEFNPEFLFRRSKTGELWSVTTPGATSTNISGATKLGEFSLVEQADPTAPFGNSITLTDARFIVASNYSVRPDL